jgi:hypothetical protein
MPIFAATCCHPRTCMGQKNTYNQMQKKKKERKRKLKRKAKKSIM